MKAEATAHAKIDISLNTTHRLLIHSIVLISRHDIKLKLELGLSLYK